MKIIIESIPHQQHRYATIGDYWLDPDNTLQIRVSQTADSRDMMLIALHELVEFYLCLWRDIPEPAIKAFDEGVPADSPYADDPGWDPSAPYHKEHVFAEILERLFAAELGREWKEYEAALSALDS